MKPFTVTVLVALGLGLGACGGEAALGEECGESGVEEECEPGGVCGKRDASDALFCLKVCTVQEDCAAGESCNGVDGTNIKGCRL